MEHELRQSPPEPAVNAESGCLPKPVSLLPHDQPPPSANLYDDLQDGQIRLFELDINTTGKIAGRLQTVEKISAPPFYALSYVCGSDAYSEEITINDHAVLVKPNLFAALQELRSYFQDKEVAHVWIWIDAICINQDNDEEKAKQIRSMHGVFSGAVEVLVWLGTVDHDLRMVLRVFAWLGFHSNFELEFEAFQQHGDEPGYQESIAKPTLEAMRSMARLEHCLKVHYHVNHANLCAMARFFDVVKHSITDRTLTEDQRTAAMDVPLLNDSLFPSDHIFWASLYALLSVEWFGRVWTYQEIRLARGPKLLVHGVSVPWKVVVHSTFYLIGGEMRTRATFDGRYPDTRTRHLPSFEKRIESAAKWHQFIISSLPPNEHIPLLLSLKTTKRRVSTMAKDHVYGLIALWQRKIQDELVIDYKRETAEVFANAVKLGLKVEFGGLLELTIADLWTAFDGPLAALATGNLPSWCPDFHNSASPAPGFQYEPLSSDMRDRIKARPCYEHTSGSETIAIRVLKLAAITKRMEDACPATSPRTDEIISALTAWLRELLQLVRSEHQANQSLMHDMWTFFHEHYPVSQQCTWFTIDHFSACLAALAALPWQSARLMLQHDILDHTLDRLSKQSGRFFFLTNSGRIGYSARRPCLQGHIILVPRHDTEIPLHMLNADCTQYIGCASVNGLMGDSLLESLDDMETKWETVVLR